MKAATVPGYRSLRIAVVCLRFISTVDFKNKSYFPKLCERSVICKSCWLIGQKQIHVRKTDGVTHSSAQTFLVLLIL